MIIALEESARRPVCRTRAAHRRRDMIEDRDDHFPRRIAEVEGREVADACVDGDARGRDEPPGLAPRLR